MAEYFDYRNGANGLSVVVARQPLSPGCMAPGEVEYHINKLKADLDRLRGQMLRALPNAGVRPGKVFDA